jgi:hypothetical protein
LKREDDRHLDKYAAVTPGVYSHATIDAEAAAATAAGALLSNVLKISRSRKTAQLRSAAHLLIYRGAVVTVGAIPTCRTRR